MFVRTFTHTKNYTHTRTHTQVDAALAHETRMRQTHARPAAGYASAPRQWWAYAIQVVISCHNVCVRPRDLM